MRAFRAKRNYHGPIEKSFLARWDEVIDAMRPDTGPKEHVPTSAAIHGSPAIRPAIPLAG
jgi:hypothetical protein